MQVSESFLFVLRHHRYLLLTMPETKPRTNSETGLSGCLKPEHKHLTSRESETKVDFQVEATAADNQN